MQRCAICLHSTPVNSIMYSYVKALQSQVKSNWTKQFFYDDGGKLKNRKIPMSGAACPLRLVIACVFACLLVSGVLFLGQDIEGFSTPEHAFRSSLLAVLGNWDWHVLEEIGHVKAAFWLWVFSIVLSLISLNMLLVPRP